MFTMVYRFHVLHGLFHDYTTLHRQAYRPGERKIEDRFGHVVHGRTAKQAVWFRFMMSRAAKRRTGVLLTSIDSYCRRQTHTHTALLASKEAFRRFL